MRSRLETRCACLLEARTRNPISFRDFGRHLRNETPEIQNPEMLFRFAVTLPQRRPTHQPTPRKIGQGQILAKHTLPVVHDNSERPVLRPSRLGDCGRRAMVNVPLGAPSVQRTGCNCAGAVHEPRIPRLRAKPAPQPGPRAPLVDGTLLWRACSRPSMMRTVPRHALPVIP